MNIKHLSFMKKDIFLAVFAVAAMASCSESEIIQTVNDDAIFFEAFTHRSTKANVITSAPDPFYVSARLGANSYFDNVSFAKGSGTEWHSTTKYYWPATETLTFYAWAAGNENGITRTDYHTFSVNVSSVTPDNQDDLIIAKADGTKAANASGMAITFQHAMSQIAIQIKNTNANLKYDIDGWKVAGFDNQATLTIATDWSGSGKVPANYWSDNTATTDAMPNTGFSKISNAEITSTAADIANASSMILIPTATATTATDKYTAADATGELNGSYIAVKMAIRNAADGAYIAGASDATIWCCWPVSFDWEPGYKYTYIVDLSQGGYYETCQATGADDDEKKVLDKVLDNAEIIFTTVNVASWDDAVIADADQPTLL